MSLRPKNKKLTKKFLVSSEAEDAVSNIVKKTPKARRAVDFLQSLKQEVYSDSVTVEGTEISKIVIGLGDSDPVVAARRQYVLQWMINSGVHPVDGTMTAVDIAALYNVEKSVITGDVRILRKKMNEVFSTPETMSNLVLSMVGECVALKYSDRQMAMKNLSEVNAVLSSLTDYFERVGWVADGQIPLDKFVLPKSLRQSKLHALTFADARNLYLRLFKLRNETFDRATSTSDSLLNVVKLLSSGLNKREPGAVDVVPGGVFSVGTFNQVNVKTPTTLDDLRKMVSERSILPVGLDEQVLQKESESMERSEREKDERVQ